MEGTSIEEIFGSFQWLFEPLWLIFPTWNVKCCTSLYIALSFTLVKWYSSGNLASYLLLGAQALCVTDDQAELCYTAFSMLIYQSPSTRHFIRLTLSGLHDIWMVCPVMVFLVFSLGKYWLLGVLRPHRLLLAAILLLLFCAKINAPWSKHPPKIPSTPLLIA